MSIIKGAFSTTTKSAYNYQLTTLEEFSQHTVQTHARNTPKKTVQNVDFPIISDINEPPYDELNKLIDRAINGELLSVTDMLKIVNNSYSALRFAIEVRKGPWPDTDVGRMAMRSIALDARDAYKYAAEVLQGPWPDTEIGRIALRSIASVYDSAYSYASRIIKGRWPNTEIGNIAEYSIMSSNLGSHYASEFVTFKNGSYLQLSKQAQILIHDIINHVYMPEVLQDSITIEITENKSKIEANPNKNFILGRQNIDKALEHFASMSVQEIEMYSNTYNSPGGRLPDYLQPLNNLEWHALLPQDFTASNGVRISSLTTSEELRKYGQYFSNCLDDSDYASWAADPSEDIGKIHLFVAFNASNTPISILQIDLHEAGSGHYVLPNRDFELEVSDHHGHTKSTPSPAKKAQRELLLSIANGSTPLSITHYNERNTLLGPKIINHINNIEFHDNASAQEIAIKTTLLDLPTNARQQQVHSELRKRLTVSLGTQTRLLRQLPDESWIAEQEAGSWAHEYADGTKVPVSPETAQTAIKTRSIVTTQYNSFIDGPIARVGVREAPGALRRNSNTLRHTQYLIHNKWYIENPNPNFPLVTHENFQVEQRAVDLNQFDPTRKQIAPDPNHSRKVMQSRRHAPTLTVPYSNSEHTTIYHTETEETKILETYLHNKGATQATVRIDDQGRYQIYSPNKEAQTTVAAALNIKPAEIIDLQTPSNTSLYAGHYNQIQIEAIIVSETQRIQAEQREKERLIAEEQEKAAQEERLAQEAQARRNARQRARFYAQSAGSAASSASNYALPVISGYKTYQDVRNQNWGSAQRNAQDTALGLGFARMHQVVPKTAELVTRYGTYSGMVSQGVPNAPGLSRTYGNLAKSVTQRFMSPLGRGLVVASAASNIRKACADNIFTPRCGITSVTQTLDALGGWVPNPVIGLGLSGAASLTNWILGNDIPTFGETVITGVRQARSGQTSRTPARPAPAAARRN